MGRTEVLTVIPTNTKQGGIWEYDQNNSGGSFTINDRVAYRVYVEADSAEDADRRAEEVGIYFDGDSDCPCCGPRWSGACGEADFISLSALEDYIKERENPKEGWMRLDYWARKGEPYIHIYLLDGRKITYTKD